MVYLQYHNGEAQGALPHPWGTERVTIYTKVASARLAAGRVLLIVGLGMPRNYYLWSSFTIEQRIVQPSGMIHLEGPGWQLSPPAPLSGRAFDLFKRACANFIGFRSIAEMAYSRELVTLADRYQRPANQSQIEASLQGLIEVTRSTTIQQQLRSVLVPQTVKVVPFANNQPEYALSVRQPHAEAILRGIKNIEYRSFATKRRGRVLLYASRIPVDDVTSCMKQYGMEREKYDDLPRGVVVGSVELYDSQGGEWYLRHPQRATKLLAPKNRPQPVWFRPFA